MGRCFAVALLSLGVLSLSCSRSGLPARQAAGLPDAAVVADAATDPSDLTPLGGLESKFEDLCRSLAPSVVAISASSQAFDSDDVLRAEDMNAEKLENLLDRTTRMVGTGLIIDAQGHILTNEHVIGEAENVWVTTDQGKVYPALVIGTDPRSDLAVLKIPATGLKPVNFAPDAPLRRGQWAIALGNPYGLAASGGQCISIGIISALDRSLPKLSKKENRLYSGLIQTTTPINPGNSGGPLFDLQGRVIGINTAVILPEKKTNGIGFAMPVSQQLLESISRMKDGQEVCYAYLGVTVSTPTPRERRAAGLSEDEGVRVESVDKGSPAESILQPDDMLVRVNDRPVHDSDHFVRVVGQAPVDHATALLISRKGEVRSVQVSLKKRQAPSTAITRDSRRMRWEGLLLGPIPKNWVAAKPLPADKAIARRAAAAADKGLVVLAVSEKSRFAKDGVKQGDVITAIAGRAVADITDLHNLLNELPPTQRAITLAGHKSTVVSTATARD